MGNTGMATSSRGLRPLVRQKDFICSKCLFTTTSSIQSGHSRWSKIKHDKGAVDAKKNFQRSQFSREIALASKLWGPDVNSNYRLASVLAAAKKAGFPKALLEGAVARGQGKSASGATLESITLEVIVPPTVAMIIESETGNRARTLMDLRYIVKRHGGSVTPTGYLFQKKGRIALRRTRRREWMMCWMMLLKLGPKMSKPMRTAVLWSGPNPVKRLLLRKLCLKVVA